MIGVDFMIWGFVFYAIVVHALLDVFRRFWGLRGTPLWLQGVLRSTPDPFGSLSVKMPPPGDVFRQNAAGGRRFIRANLALIKRHLQVAFYHRTPPEGGTLLDRAQFHRVCVFCASLTPF